MAVVGRSPREGRTALRPQLKTLPNPQARQRFAGEGRPAPRHVAQHRGPAARRNSSKACLGRVHALGAQGTVANQKGATQLCAP